MRLTDMPVPARLRTIRAMALSEGDRNLVVEIEREMSRLGIPFVETAIPAESFEVAVGPRPRGRPRKG